MLSNVVELDGLSRAASWHYRDRGDFKPIVLAFDFAQAFPSVRQSWLHCTLSVSKVPAGFRKAVVQLYLLNPCSMVTGGVSCLIFWITSGIVQGCPLSGSLFVAASNPFYRDMEGPSRVGSRGPSGLCG